MLSVDRSQIFVGKYQSENWIIICKFVIPFRSATTHAWYVQHLYIAVNLFRYKNKYLHWKNKIAVQINN